MSRRIVLTVVCLLSLLLIVLPPTSAGDSPETRLYVNPPATSVIVDNAFTIGVKIADVWELSSFYFKLNWNDTLLDLLKIGLLPWWFKYIISINETGVDPETGLNYWEIAVELTELPYTGTVTLAGLTFKAVGVESSILDLYDTRLVDEHANPIPHNVYDGFVKAFFPVPHPAQSIWVDPSFIDLRTCYTFTVNVMINITDPDPTRSPPDGLVGFSYVLKWDKTNIDLMGRATHVPPWGGGLYIMPDNTVYDFNATHKAHSLCIVAHAELYPFTGVVSVCTYNFHVVYPGPYPYNGTLDLQDTRLANDLEAGPIPHTAYDGQYRISSRRSPDINLDGIVDIFDVVLATLAFGSRPGRPNWNQDADLNCDNLIDIFDLVIIGINYGKTG